MTLDTRPVGPEPVNRTEPRRRRRGPAGAALSGLATVIALWFGLAAPTVSPVAAPSLSAAQVAQAPVTAPAVPAVTPTDTGAAQGVADDDGGRDVRNRDDGRGGNPGGRR